ncbi:MAG: methyltransferase C-terminal domain-containing protein [Rhodocyclaceae bacterium]
MRCRHCGCELELPLIDLGSAPPSNAYLTQERLRAPEKWFPLRVLVCERCWLVQTEDFARADELFGADYAYFSGYSASWLAHCQRYVADVVARFGLHAGSHVVEIAANDGSLLQYVRERGIPCMGVEPTASTAAAGRAKGIAVVQDFFGSRLAKQLVAGGRRADLLVANNVLAHVPDINDFVAGCALLLAPQGVASFEFPHLVELVEHCQFDTIYHEHYSYLSLHAVERVFAHGGLSVFDVEQLATHGGSLRVYAQRSDSGSHPEHPRVASLRALEAARGVATAAYYAQLQARAERIKDDLLCFLIEAKRRGEKVAGYGAAAKGNTLLNFAGVRRDLLGFVADRNPAKQGKYLPGSRIPVRGEEALRSARPDHVLILPWNLAEELTTQLSYIGEWGGSLVRAVPELEVRRAASPASAVAMKTA